MNRAWGTPSCEIGCDCARCATWVAVWLALEPTMALVDGQDVFVEIEAFMGSARDADDDVSRVASFRDALDAVTADWMPLAEREMLTRWVARALLRSGS